MLFSDFNNLISICLKICLRWISERKTKSHVSSLFKLAHTRIQKKISLLVLRGIRILDGKEIGPKIIEIKDNKILERNLLLFICVIQKFVNAIYLFISFWIWPICYLLSFWPWFTFTNTFFLFQCCWMTWIRRNIFLYRIQFLIETKLIS